MSIFGLTTGGVGAEGVQRGGVLLLKRRALGVDLGLAAPDGRPVGLPTREGAEDLARLVPLGNEWQDLIVREAVVVAVGTVGAAAPTFGLKEAVLVAIGAMAAALPAFGLEFLRRRNTLNTRWDDRLLEESAKLVVAARKLRAVAQRLLRDADESAASIDRDQDLRSLLALDDDLRIQAELVRLLGKKPTATLARQVVRDAYNVRRIAEGKEDSRPGADLPVTRMMKSLTEFYRAVRVELQVDDASDVAEDPLD